ncbi:MAG: InlB B-repeat-containing protein, partial [Erysipelotrichaceae bacterium]|nr:InlB B-repeat-containing protein [Erysipelotrichaceae bacterium]
GKELENLVYNVNIYKNNSKINTYETHWNNGSSTNVINNISNYFPYENEGYGYGEYTFDVSISVPNDNRFIGSTSTLSGRFVAPKLTVTGDNGINSVTPDTTSATIVVVPGQSLPVSAALKSETAYEFVRWEGSGASFADATSKETTMTVNGDYNGSTELTITAISKDIKAPDVSDPVLSNEENTISATICDSEDGLKYYAFSTVTSADNVSDWIEIQPVTGSNTYTYAVTESGTYYVFAKDVEGNTSRSSEGIKATQLTMHNYPKEGGSTGDESAFIIGSSGVTLPTDLTRNGYTFGGWYTENSYENEALTSYDSHDRNIEVYAKWDENKLPTNIEITGIDCPYDGTEKTLQVPQESLVNKGKITYQWYKGDTPIEGATTSSLKVKNVADSGDYKVVIKLFDDADQPLDETTISGVSVAISKADLKVAADNKEVYFNEDPPTYTYTFVEGFGFKNNDDEVDLSAYLTCTYTKGNKVDDYTISWGNGNIELDNYNVTTTSGKLTVNRVSSALSVEFAEDVTDLHYTGPGQAITPAVTVKLGERTLESDEYSVTYSNNTNAGEATLKVDLLGNYTGSKTLNFTIKKASIAPTVSIKGWKYGESASDPVLEGNSTENGFVTFLYGLKDSEDFNTGKPTQAGTYEVYATVAETDNYEAATTQKVTFKIAKRSIEITANSATFTYDGLAHSDNGYTKSDESDEFAYGEGFYSVSVNGSVTDVTDESETGNNTITYTLSSNTSADNYNITTVPGTLTVVP